MHWWSRLLDHKSGEHVNEVAGLNDAITARIRLRRPPIKTENRWPLRVVCTVAGIAWLHVALSLMRTVWC